MQTIFDLLNSVLTFLNGGTILAVGLLGIMIFSAVTFLMSLILDGGDRVRKILLLALCLAAMAAYLNLFHPISVFRGPLIGIATIFAAIGIWKEIQDMTRLE